MQTQVTGIGATGLPLRGARSLASRSFATLPKQQYHAQAISSKRCVRRASSASSEADEPEGLTGEWPVNWSLASYEDVGEFFQNSLFKASASPGNSLQDIMNTKLTYTFPEVDLKEVGNLFKEVSGVPVVKSESDKTLVGVLSKKDLSKPGKLVKDVYSSPPIAARPENKVADAACLMLKHKVHRIPVVDNQAKLVGIVTRTDIFTALEST